MRSPAESRLRFEGPVIIVGGGAITPEAVRAVYRPGRGLVGADIGGDVIRAAGLVPDAVIGDFDSLPDPRVFAPPTRLLPLADQDTTDFEKALLWTEAPLTLALGMTGGRLDHTLAALHALARFAPTRRLVLVDGEDIALTVVGSAALDLPAGTRVSIYPLAPVTFSGSSGLLYPLKGLAMNQGEVIGTSNRATAERIEIRLAPGETNPWLLIVPRALLEPVIAQLV